MSFGALLGPALAGGATAGAASGLTALTIVGTAIAGIGSAMMKKAEIDAEEEQEIAAEERRKASFEGIGAAADFGHSSEFTDPKSERGVLEPRLNATQGIQQRVGSPSARLKNQPSPSLGKISYDPARRRVIRGR